MTLPQPHITLSSHSYTQREEEMGSISAASGTTVLPYHLRRQNNRRSVLYDHRHENLPVVSSSQTKQQRWLYVPETKLKRETLRLGFLARAADSTSSSPPVVASGDKTLIPDDEFTLDKVFLSTAFFFEKNKIKILMKLRYMQISFGVIGLGLGVSLLS